MTSPSPADIAACDREPIRIPGSIQPHGALLVLDAELRIVQASANAGAWLELRLDPMAAPLLADALPAGWEPLPPMLKAWVQGPERNFLYARESGGRFATALAHRSGAWAVLEFEASVPDPMAAGRLQGRLQACVEQIGVTGDAQALCRLAAAQVRELTGFNRVLIYRFGADWSGAVVAEDRDDALPSYMDLRFPASDIPAQARELYRLNRMRIIPDADYAPSPIIPAPGFPAEGPLDLSFATLRSVSPVHTEYMRNMGTPASMSVSILVEGELWGLISCHHASPRLVPLQIRSACDFLGQVLAVRLGALLRTEDARRRIELAGVQAQLLGCMAKEKTFSDGLLHEPEAWMSLVGATGAAFCAGGDVFAVGATPDIPQIRYIAEWLEGRGGPDVFSSSSLGQDIAGADAFAGVASGLLAVRISELRPNYVLWFRPEAIGEVTWGGDPRKTTAGGAEERLHPRKSFDMWKEEVRGQSTAWANAEVETARAFRTAILAIVLRQAEERAELTGELQRSNRELEAFSYSISHDLRAPFRHIVGYAELLQEKEATLDKTSRHYIRSIRDAALSAGRLVDDLLQFSRIGRASLATGRVDMNKLVSEARRSLLIDLEGREVEWRIDSLPPAFGDAAMLRQSLLNLLSNALKYTRPRPVAEIGVSARETEEEIIYTVRDNGVGFDMAYADKLFGVFQRLHRAEDFEGTGIGLAIVERVIERHNGRIWAEGAVDQGAAFHFALPRLKLGTRRG